MRAVRSFGARGNALVQSLFAGPMVLIKDPLQNRPKVVEPLKVAQEILQVCTAVYLFSSVIPISFEPILSIQTPNLIFLVHVGN